MTSTRRGTGPLPATSTTPCASMKARASAALIMRQVPTVSRNVPAIDDESRALRNLIVQPPRDQIGFVCLPVGARRARLLRAPVHGLDECPPHTRAPHLWH